MLFNVNMIADEWEKNVYLNFSQYLLLNKEVKFQVETIEHIF